MTIQKEPLWLAEAFNALDREKDSDMELIMSHPEKFGMSRQELEALFAPYQAYRDAVLPELLTLLKENKALRIYWDEDGTGDVSDKEDKYLCYAVFHGAAILFADERHPEKLAKWGAKEKREEEQLCRTSKLIGWILNFFLSEGGRARAGEERTAAIPKRIASVQELTGLLEQLSVPIAWKYRLVYLYLNQEEFYREFQKTAEKMALLLKKRFALIADLYEEMRQKTEGEGLRKLIEEGNSGLKLSLEEIEGLSVHLSVFRYNGISYHDWGDWREQGKEQIFMMEVGMFIWRLVSGQEEKGLLTITEVQAVCKALGDGSRYRILELILQKGRMYLQELSREIGLTPATISHHISVLMDADLLQLEMGETEKKIIHYAVSQRQLERITATFRQLAEEARERQ